MSRLLSWLQWSGKRVPHRETWSLDRNPHRKEAQRLLRSGSYAEAERHLLNEIAEAELRNFSPARRIALRLELAEAQRKQSLIEDREEDAAIWLASAEKSARQAIALAAQTHDGAAYVQALDVLAEIF